MSKTPLIWQPKDEHFNSRVAHFAESNGLDGQDWQKLIAKSIEDIDWFWNSFLEQAKLQWSKPYTRLLDSSKGLAWSDWFIGGRTNIAYNCLDWHLKETSQIFASNPLAREHAGSKHLALLWENESGETRKLTYGELDILAGKTAALLKQLGLKKGDAAGIYMPMIPEVLAVLFGCFKLGVVAVPVFSGFGPEALAKRMQDAEAKVIFTADAGKRRGKLLLLKQDVDQIRTTVPSLQHVIVVKYSGNEIEWLQKDSCLSGFENACHHDQAADIEFSTAIESVKPLATMVDLDSQHPCLYLYTSGTTGKPKGTIHTHAGAMSQIAKELGLVFDLQKKDRFFWLTDIGWMMGPWEMIGVTFWGGTLVMYDGAPDYPLKDNLWRLISKHQVTKLGISPTAIRILREQTDSVIDKHDFSTLKYLGSTGEAWDEDNYIWFYNKIGQGRCPIMNISGGTELIGCLLTPLPTMPLPPCSLGSRALAMDVDVYDESGNSCIDTIGHLVLKQPAPSLTRSFLHDRDRYLETYFSRFDNIWYHGDWAERTIDDYWFLYGRSDDTIKISGKRIGPGEIEAALIEYPSVKEAAAIGIPDKLKGEALVCFVVLNQNVKPEPHLKDAIVKAAVTKFGAMARPKELYFVATLPKTRSGKIVRSAIRKKYLGEDVDASSIENPESLAAIGVEHN